MIDPNDHAALYQALARHPETLALVAFVAEDCGDFDPDSVNWGVVEDIMTERGHEAIHTLGSPKED